MDDNHRFLYALGVGWAVSGFLLWLTFRLRRGGRFSPDCGLRLRANALKRQTTRSHSPHAAA